MPHGHDILPPVLSSPKLYLAPSITTVSAVDKTPILCPSLGNTFKTPHSVHLLDLSPELLSTFTMLYCTVATPSGTNATAGEVAHEPGQSDTAPPSPAISSWSCIASY